MKSLRVMGKIDSLLKKLTESYAVTGKEKDIHNLVRSLLEGHCDSIETDQFGNIIAFKKGKAKGSVLVVCHLDEIGFIVKEIEEGYLRVAEVGGSDSRILPGQMVVVLIEPPIFGVVGIKPPHYTTKEDREKTIPLKDLFIDTGLEPDDLKKKVRIGDLVGLHSPYVKLNDRYRSGKSLDNRVGVACGIETLIQTDPHLDLYLILSCQEEFSGLGATITSYRIDPDFAIVIDVTHGPHPGAPEFQTFEMDRGPVIGTGPTLDRNLFSQIKRLADDLEMPYQIEPLPKRTGTDADSVAFTKEGVRTVLVEVPIKYMHSPVEVVCIRDLEKTVRLLKEFLSRGH